MTPAALCSFGGAQAGQGDKVDAAAPSGVGSWPCPCGMVAPVAGGRYLPHAEPPPEVCMCSAGDGSTVCPWEEHCYGVWQDRRAAADADSLGAALARFVQHGGTL